MGTCVCQFQYNYWKRDPNKNMIKSHFWVYTPDYRIPYACHNGPADWKIGPGECQIACDKAAAAFNAATIPGKADFELDESIKYEANSDQVVIEGERYPHNFPVVATDPLPLQRRASRCE